MIEQTKHESTSFALILLSTLAEGVFAIDAEGKIIYINPAAEILLGYETNELLGRNGHDTFHYQYEDGSPLSRENCLLIKALTTGQALSSFEDTLTRKDGTTFPARCTSSPIFQDGKIVGATQSFHNIAKEKQAEEALILAKEEAIAANKKKSEFLSMMSHELRTPLNAIIGYSRMVENGMAGPINDKQQTYLCNVGKSAQHLLNLINNLLDTAKVEADKLDIIIEQIELPSIINEVKMIMAPIVVEKNIRLTFEISTDLNTIAADSARFKQILINLISNAIKFNHRNGSVHVRFNLSQDGQWLIGEVEDTGIGIPKSKLLQLFQKFYQVDNGLSRKHEGTGLGLALTKEIVELHGGTILVESNEGQGTCFQFKLPTTSNLL